MLFISDVDRKDNIELLDGVEEEVSGDEVDQDYTEYMTGRYIKNLMTIRYLCLRRSFLGQGTMIMDCKLYSKEIWLTFGRNLIGHTLKEI